MDNKTKELIAIGASITANCQLCLQYHDNNAREAGATKEEIKEAVKVGQAVKKGATGQMNEFIASMDLNSESCGKGCKCG